MGIIKQDSWLSGEINPNLVDANTNEKYYTSALNVENMYLTKSQTLKRMLSTEIVSNALSLSGNLVISSIYLDVISFFTVEKLTTTTEFKAYTYDSVTNNFFLKDTQTLTVAYDILDYVSFENKIILTVQDNKPLIIQYTITSGDISAFTVGDLPIISQPTLDFGEIDYSQWEFDFVTNAPASVNEQVRCTITKGVNLTNIFNDNDKWIGGSLYSLGDSTSNFLGYGKIVSIENLAATTADLIIDVKENFEIAKVKGSRVSLQQNIFFDDTEYPQRVGFFDGRLYLANTKSLPMLIAGSKINLINDFDAGKGLPAEAIVYILKDNTSSKINHVVGLKGLYIFSDTQEHLVLQAVDEGITPQNFISTKVSDFGTSLVKPKIYNDMVYTVDKTDRRIIAFDSEGKIMIVTEGMNIDEDITQLVVLDSKLMGIKALCFLYASGTFLNMIISTGQFHGLFKVSITPFKLVTLAIDDRGFIANIGNTTTSENGIFSISKDVQGLTGYSDKNNFTFPLAHDGFLYNNTTQNYITITAGTTPTAEQLAESDIFGYKTNVFVKSIPWAGDKIAEYTYENVSSYYISYYNSSRFKVNGFTVAKDDISELASQSIVLKTGNEVIRSSNSPRARRFIEITSDYPYDIEVLSYGVNMKNYIMG